MTCRSRWVGLLATFGLVVVANARGEEKILLWPNGAPLAVGETEADRPSLTYFPAKPGRGEGGIAAVILMPGGGYTGLATGHEGADCCRWLNQRGIAGFVLRYRLTPRYQHPAPLLDGQRAIRWVRANAEELGIDPSRIGVWGFSAGGHLASVTATRYDDGDSMASDPVDRVSCRPDLAILCYPLITLRGKYASAFIRYRLLGPNPSDEEVNGLSAETMVNRRTPPAFLFHTSDDETVSWENSILFYQAMRGAGVPAELHLYESGKHGLGLATRHPVLSSWPQRLGDWLELRGFSAARQEPVGK